MYLDFQERLTNFMYTCFSIRKKNEYNTRPEGLKEERDQARSLLNSTATKKFPPGRRRKHQEFPSSHRLTTTGRTGQTRCPGAHAWSSCSTDLAPVAPATPAALPPLLDPSVSAPLRVDRDPHAGSLAENVRVRNDGHRPDWPSRMLLPARLLPSPPPAPVLTLTPRRVLPPRLERNATRLVVRWSFPAAARSRSRADAA